MSYRSSKVSNVSPSATSGATVGWRAVRAYRTGARVERGAGRGHEEVDAAWPEPHDDDAAGRPHHPVGVGVDGVPPPPPPLGLLLGVRGAAGETTRPLARSQMP